MSYLAIAKEVEARLRAAGNTHSTEGKQRATPSEHLATAVLAENTPDEVTAILAAWDELLGIKLNRERVLNHLQELRRWQTFWFSNGSRNTP